ncbi:MAG: peptidylprolyl isomerase [Bacteroidaceae bacterium]|nr:peptidylprolyl isomerase [Bacteroidaceae bacterium]
MKKIVLFLLLALTMGACKAEKKGEVYTRSVAEGETVVLFETSAGNFKVKLYNETPKHRDNFIKLVKDKTYEGIIFHRVIKSFMIQAGDPTAKNVPPGEACGAGDIGYTVPCEIVYPKYYHKFGALAAARENDDVNPKRESSGCQFYIVTGQKWTQPKLEFKEKELNDARLKVYFDSISASHHDEIVSLRKAKAVDKLSALQDTMEAQAKQKLQENPAFKITPEMLKDYTTLGGTPHLDNAYTVFGEVIEGFDVINDIQQVRTDRRNRPVDDVTIIKVSLVQ